MRVPRIYIPDITPAEDIVLLDGQAARHLIKVLRVTTEQPLILFDGSGTEYNAVVVETGTSSLKVQLLSTDSINRESGLCITLVQAISRGDRMDWLLQKTTELGVSNIYPVFSKRSMVKLDKKRLQTRMQHWQGIIIHACEQCGRNRLPHLNIPLGLSTAVEQLASNTSSYFLDANASLRFRQLLQTTSVNLFIGPEGGFEDAEKTFMIDHGVQPVSMGPRTLRTETAGISAVAALGTLWGDM
jgi:16S rRNA (uracil1498-N3)-methyltransferase